MVDFNSFIQYTVLAALLHVPRKDLRKDVRSAAQPLQPCLALAQRGNRAHPAVAPFQVVESPDVLTVIDQLPHLGELLNGFYDCEYRRSFKAMGAWVGLRPGLGLSPGSVARVTHVTRALAPLPPVPVELHPLMLRDPYMAAHAQFYLREYRIRAYAQFLEAYRSVTLGAMAETFGVSVPFIDACVAAPSPSPTPSPRSLRGWPPTSHRALHSLCAASWRVSSARAACTPRSTRSAGCWRPTGRTRRTRSTWRWWRRGTACSTGCRTWRAPSTRGKGEGRPTRGCRARV